MKRHKDSGMTLEDYLAIEYPITVIPCLEDGGYFARIPDLPGCMTEGDTLEELFYNIDEAKTLWLEGAIEDGDPIKVPEKKEYSGRFIIRLPKSLHRELTEEAEAEGVSLNSYIMHLLSARSSCASPAEAKKNSPGAPTDAAVAEEDGDYEV